MKMQLADIPVAILCGGSGTRLREQTEFIPKPMIPIGGRPMLIHIMKWYAKFGFNNFVLALGYKQEIFKQYFLNYNAINNDIMVATGKEAYWEMKECCICGNSSDNWNVTLSDTGEHTLKGGRLKRIQKFLQTDIFMMTYGDGIGDIPLDKLVDFHLAQNKLVTITGVAHPSRFGVLELDGNCAACYTEKPSASNQYINGGFMVFDQRIFNYLSDDCDLETDVFTRLAEIGEIAVFRHTGQWMCMDTPLDMGRLQETWAKGEAKWQVK